MRSHRALAWLRRTIRLQDNSPLWHALQDAEEVVPILVLNPDSSYLTNTPRREFIRQAIAELDASLRARGSRLHVRIGKPETEIPAAVSEYGASTVYAARLYDEPAILRDEKIAASLSNTGAGLTLVKDRVLWESQDIRTGDDRPYRVFTPYKRRWLGFSEDVPRPLPTIRRLESVPLGSGSIDLDKIPGFKNSLRRGGESAALERLRLFMDSSVSDYEGRRDLPGIDGTSRLSHHLAIGTISPRQIYWSAMERLESRGTRKGVETFLSELIWREFYYQIMSAFPHVLKTSFREEFRHIPWSRSSSAFERWKMGSTGYPIVDAAMRQLEEEGWMHNRARMIVASFLTKDLHLNWQWGERYFAGRLVDLDLASNNGGWQWTAGTGTDASPWFRIFNPVSQGKRFDSEGNYVRRYVPELRSVPTRFIHEPWRMTHQDQQAYECVIGKGYPARIVDHNNERAVTLSLYSMKPLKRARP
jgi:deoxyribodipyrimidine photo-lyase